MEALKKQYEKSLEDYKYLVAQASLNRGTPPILIQLAKKKLEQDKKALEDYLQMKSNS